MQMYSYVVFVLDSDKRVTVAGAYTSQGKAVKRRNALMDSGLKVNMERIVVNEETNILLNIWTHTS